MTDESNPITAKPTSKHSLIIAILIGAWMIGMSILGAGLLITKELAKHEVAVSTTDQTSRVNIEVPAGSRVLGNNHAKVTIVEFADFQCPFCGQFQKTIFPQIKSQYIDIGKVRFVYMDYAFLGEESIKAAEAGMCADEQNRFWDYHDKLFASQAGENEGAFTDDHLKQFAKELNLDVSMFNTCLESDKYRTAVNGDLDQAANYGVQSTPTIFIDGLKMEGVMPYDSYKQLIDNELTR